MRSLLARAWPVMLATVMLLGVTVDAGAQEETPQPPVGVKLLTPYTGIAVEPGDTASFQLDVKAPLREEVTLDISNLPQGWGALVRGGGMVVNRVLVDPDLHENLKLDVDVPPETAEGTYEVVLTANSHSGRDRLDLEVVVAEAVGGGISLNAEFPRLQGPSDVTFTYTLELSNDTGEDVQFGLEAEGPGGWQVSARPSGQSRASTVTVAAGGSERITVDVDPPDFTAAGVYPVAVRAAGGGNTVDAQLAVEITGNFDMALATADQRLNVAVEAGHSSDLDVTVFNQGTAPLTDIMLSATPPSGWDVTFTPEVIGPIEAGGAATATATVTPSGDAITGDYRITVRARAPETSDEIEVRATVKTSSVWGFVGIGVIVAALAALAIVFRRFGRR